MSKTHPVHTNETRTVLNHTKGIPNIFLPGQDLEDGRRVLAIAKHNHNDKEYLVLCQWHDQFVSWILVNHVGEKPCTVYGEYSRSLSEAVDMYNFRLTQYGDNTWTLYEE